MAAKYIDGIQTDTLIWARESIGLSTSNVAKVMKKPIEVIEGWENGSTKLTYSQLEKLAYTIYKRPLAIFFLPEPPTEISPIQEFRSLPESELENLAPNTRINIRNGHAYQLALEELYQGVNPSKIKLWEDIILTRSDNIKKQAMLIRDYIGITPEKQASLTDDESLKYWRQKIESLGIFIFKSAFKQKDISGFCLISKTFPIIYLNNSTTKTRQLFSLIHELAHILLQTNSINKFDQADNDKLPEDERAIEVFCNKIAAETLMPSSDFIESTKHLPRNIELVPDAELSLLARRYGVSREAILRKFLDQDRVSTNYYKLKAKLWANQATKNKPGGNWFSTTRSYLSNTFSNEVYRQHLQERISTEKASDLLGIKAKNFNTLEQISIEGIN